VPADVMCCEAEAGAATPKVSPCPTPGHNQPKPRHTAVVLVARQTCALTRGRRCKPVRGLSKGPLSCECVWRECIGGQGGGVRQCRPIAPGGKPCPKSLMGSCAGGDAPSPVGPRAGRGGEEAGLHVQAELRWGWGVAWGRPRAQARAPPSPARSPCPGAESTCICAYNVP
jgi:hypothetical protein